MGCCDLGVGVRYGVLWVELVLVGCFDLCVLCVVRCVSYEL